MSSITLEQLGRTRPAARAHEKARTHRAVGTPEKESSGPAMGVLVRTGHGGEEKVVGHRSISRTQLGLVGTLGPLGIAFLALAALPHRKFDFGAVLGPEAATMLMLVALTAAVLFLFPGATSGSSGRYRWTSRPGQFLGPFEAAQAVDGALELVRQQAQGLASSDVVLEVSRRGVALTPGGRGAAGVRLTWREIQSIDLVRGERDGVQVTTRSGRRAVFAADVDRGLEKTLAALGAEIVAVEG